MTGKARVALFTSQDVGRTLVEHFADRDLLVVSYDQAKDAGYGYRSALDFCRENGIRHLEAPKADQRVLNALQAHQPDIIVCCWYAKILPPAMLDTAPLAINVHPGKLPFYKGRWPTPWYILNGDPTYGVAVHKMVDEVDAGDVFVQNEFPIPSTMTGHELVRETMRTSGDAIMQNFDGILSGRLQPTPQPPGGSRYDHLDKTYEVDWSQPAEIINRHIRVHARPYAPATALLDGRRVAINRATIVAGEGRPGALIAPMTVACGRDALLLEEVFPE